LYTHIMKQPSPRHWDWYIAILLLALLYTISVRLAATEWTRELNYIEPIAMLGGLLGMALGFSRFDRRIVRWLVFEYSLVAIPVQAMRMVTGEMPALERLASAGGRLAFTFGQLIGRQPIEDPIFFLTLMSALYWAIGIYTGFQLLRGTGLLGVFVLPTIPLLVVQYYDSYHADRLWIIAFYFFLLLLFVGRANLLRNQERWLAGRVFSGSEPGFDLSNSMAVSALVVVLVAWMLPTPAAALPAAAAFWRQVNQPLQATRDRLNDILAALHGETSAGGELYGSTLSLGNEAGQDAGEMFTVTPPSVTYPRYYWRVRVYDTYVANQWRTLAESKTKEFSLGDANLPTKSVFGPTGSFYFNWKSNKTALFAAPSQPIWISRSSIIEYASADPGQLDLLNWRAQPDIQPGDQYQARAALINPSVADLRKAPAVYPEWVTERYLQTPEDLSSEISNLAKNLTRDARTPYDKAQVITNYLHNQITYKLSVPPPPPGMAPLDWFLFVVRSGYCNYYATAEVLMLRAAGVPARLAVGYAQGELKNGAFIVRGRDAHAWPEVYFPTIGWVEFEPTTSQEPIARPPDRLPAQSRPAATPLANPVRPRDRILREPPDPLENVGTRSSPGFKMQTIWWWVIIITAVAAAGYAIWRYNQKWPLAQRVPQFVRRQYQRAGVPVPVWVENWVRWSELTSVERSFHAINQSLTWLGQSQPAHVTPAERADLLKQTIPSLTAEIDILTAQHENTLFSRIPGDPGKAASAAWKIRYRTLRSIVRHRLIGEEYA
jgi:transglutaminase-like putative cysteine protease